MTSRDNGDNGVTSCDNGVTSRDNGVTSRDNGVTSRDNGNQNWGSNPIRGPVINELRRKAGMYRSVLGPLLLYWIRYVSRGMVGASESVAIR